MAVDVRTETLIDRPMTVVADYAGDPANAPAWYANIDRVEPAGPDRWTFEARFLGRTLRYTYEIVESTPSRLVMRTAQGPFPMETTYTWEPAGEGATRMTLRNRGEPTGFGKLPALVMAPAMRRANKKDLAMLKAILEREEGRAPGGGD